MFTAPAGSHIAVTSVLMLAASAAAYDNTMYDSSDPASYGNLIASLDTNSTGYNFPAGAGLSSGYINEVAGFEFDRTQLITEVYAVHTAQTISMGGDTMNLDVGDRVFAYRLRLVEASTNTINALREFTVTGLGLIPGSDTLETSLVKGRGYHLSGGPVNTPDAGAGDFQDFGPIGGTLDFRFEGADVDQLNNNQEITFLMFTEPSAIGDGFANFAAAPGQASGVDPNANNAPVLIPIIPTPGSVMMLSIAGIGLSARRIRR